MSMLNSIFPSKSNELSRLLLLQVESENGGMTWWGALLLLGLIILILVLALAWNASKTIVPEGGHHTAEAHDARMPTPASAAQADDLVIIEGIGPKIASLMQENGITTFDQLGNAGLDILRSILDKAGLRFIDPGSWSEQAQLAAKADWTALEALQARLKGGRE